MQQIFVSKWLNANFGKRKIKINKKRRRREKKTHLQNLTRMYDDPIRLS